MLCMSALAADLQSLYEKRKLFDLRDHVVSGQSTPFLRTVIACTFNDESACPREAHSLLGTHPPDDIAIKTLDLLFDFYFSRGQWKPALEAVEAEVALRGESEDPDNMREMCRALLKHGSMQIDRSGHSEIRVLYKNAHVPFQVNGKTFNGFVDTGANISFLSESAAQYLGLTIESARFRFGGAAGKGVPITHIAVAERFVIGNIELRRVPFVVVSDRQQPFAGWGKGKRCVLGLQILLAARNMTWRGKGLGATLELARPSAPRSLAEANLCLDGKTPVVAAEQQGRRVTMFIDTGAGPSVMRRAFAEVAREAVSRAPKRTLFFDGVDGEAKAVAAIVPELSLSVGGRTVRFRKMAVYLEGPGADRYDGMFGNDLTRHAREFTLDFEAMRITLH